MKRQKHWIWGQILFKREGMMEEAQAQAQQLEDQGQQLGL